MKILIIGSTGPTGLILTRQLLDVGHNVTVLVRNPGKLADLAEQVTVVQGDARDAIVLKRATQGQDAVMSALGIRSFGKTDLQQRFIGALIAAAHDKPVLRYVGLSAWGVGDSVASAGIMSKIAARTVLRNVFADKARSEELLSSSSLSYVLVRPGILTNGPKRGGVAANGDGSNLGPSMSRADVCSFMIGCLVDDTWLGQTPIIGYSTS